MKSKKEKTDATCCDTVSAKEKRECAGCTACANICPVNAIQMKEDEEGFLYPFVDVNKCIHCGLCVKVCRFQESDVAEPLKAFAVKYKDNSVRISSRSGGAFIAFSDWILEFGGLVYGAVMQNDCSVRHMRAETAVDRDKMKKAKYVQSELQDTFSSVYSDLKNGKYVLFSGTPCQVSGLLGYLDTKGVDRQKLYTCDLICHGVPSPMVWRDYLNYIRTKYKKEIKEAQFRDKALGWETHCESFLLQGEKKKRYMREYTELFYQHIMFRPSCYNCKFANLHRISDITLGDFWGIEKHSSEFNDNKGVSLIFVNTQKGKELFEETKEFLEFFECRPDECLQPTLQKPSKPSPRRQMFWKDYSQKNFHYIITKYPVPTSFTARVKYYLKRIMYKTGFRTSP